MDDPYMDDTSGARSRVGWFRSVVGTTKFETLKKFQYLLIVVVCTVVLVYQTSECVDKYLQKNTGTGDKYVHISKTAFPTMTICPTYAYNLSALGANGVGDGGPLSRTEIQWNANWLPNDTSKTPQEFYDEIVLKAEDVIDFVRIYTEKQIDGKNMLKLNPNDKVCGQEIFIKKQYYYNGDCFALNPPDCVLEAGILEVLFDFLDKTDIFIHHRDQFLSPNSRFEWVFFNLFFQECLTFRSRVDVEKGSFVKIAVNHEVVQLLSEKGNCVDSYEEYETFDGCMYSKLNELMVNAIGCTVPWLPDKSRICTDKARSEVAFDIYQKNRRNQQDVCPVSCLFTNMYFGPPVTGKLEYDDRAWGVFYFRREIKTTNEYFLYSILSMAAEIGAYVGLLLGASLVNMGRINSFLMDMACDKKKKEDNQIRPFSPNVTKPKAKMISVVA